MTSQTQKWKQKKDTKTDEKMSGLLVLSMALVLDQTKHNMNSRPKVASMLLFQSEPVVWFWSESMK